MDMLMEFMGKGFLTMLLLSMPAVLAAASIGLVVGILQAVTQVQEQTIAAAPKVLGVFLIIIAMGPFSARTLSDYFREGTNIAFNILPQSEKMVLSKEQFFKYKQETVENEYYNEKTINIKELMKNPGKVPVVGRRYKKSIKILPRSSASQPNFLEKKKINSGKKQ